MCPASPVWALKEGYVRYTMKDYYRFVIYLHALNAIYETTCTYIHINGKPDFTGSKKYEFY